MIPISLSVKVIVAYKKEEKLYDAHFVDAENHVKFCWVYKKQNSFSVTDMSSKNGFIYFYAVLTFFLLSCPSVSCCFSYELETPCSLF